MKVSFLKSVLEDGIENPNFFNGRVLTAEDLRDLQRAGRMRGQRLGKAIGAGVVSGLIVSPSEDKTSLLVTPGLAVNPQGDALVLPKIPKKDPVSIPLQTVLPKVSGLIESPFASCQPDQDDECSHTETFESSPVAGFWMLAITGATGVSEETAHTNAINPPKMPCVSRYEVEGVQFKLISLEDVFQPSDDEKLWQSRLAGACFGLQELLASQNPFNQPVLPDGKTAFGPWDYGIVGDLRTNGCLSDCDVPLAVLHWLDQEIQLLDMWVVRRPVTLPLITPWPQHVGERRLIEAQAFFLQFQMQLEQLRVSLDDPQTVKASEYFQYLPAAGYLPLHTEGNYHGYNISNFFAPSTPEKFEIDVAFLREIFQRSFYHDPVPTNEDEQLPIKLYEVAGTDTYPPFVIFSRRLPFPVWIAPQEEDQGAEPPPEGEVDDTSPPEVVEPPEKPGKVAVLLEGGGKSLSPNDILRVTAVPRGETAPIIEAENIEIYSLAEQFYLITDLSIVAYFDLAYIFPPLPPGEYIIQAVPASGPDLLSASTSIDLAPGEEMLIQLSLQPVPEVEGPFTWEEGYRYNDLGWLLESGYIVDKFLLSTIWCERNIILCKGAYDPLPPDWEMPLSPEILLLLEAVLDDWTRIRPDIAVSDPKVFIRPDYDPSESYADPYAYVVTADDSRLPMILVTNDTSLIGEVSIGKTDIPELEDPAYGTALRNVGLRHLDVAANAWTGLLSSALPLDEAGSAALLGEFRNAAIGLQSSLQRYPGVSEEVENALKNAGIENDVDLANATAAAIEAALGQNYSSGFATRLIDYARGNVPDEGWSVGTLGLSNSQVEALNRLGVTSQGELLALNELQDGVDQLQGALGMDEESLGQVLTSAAISIAVGAALLTPLVAVINVEGVSKKQAKTLVGIGITTADALAVADPELIAAELNITLNKAESMVANAGKQSVMSLAVFGLEDDAITSLTNMEITNVTNMSAADVTATSNIVGGDIVANHLKNLSEHIVDDRVVGGMASPVDMPQ